MNTSSPSDALRISDVSISYDSTPLISSFSLTLKGGEKVILTGDSGTGKSSILRTILGFVLPTRGTICVNDTCLAEDTVWEIRRQTAYVPQDPRALPGTVDAFLRHPFTFAANAALRDNLTHIPALFDTFNLSVTLREKEYSSLSGGERQRVAFIAALLLDRPLLLLDEVTSALDETNAKAIASFLSARTDTTILAVAHDAQRLTFADRVVPLSTGSAS